MMFEFISNCSTVAWCRVGWVDSSSHAFVAPDPKHPYSVAIHGYGRPYYRGKKGNGAVWTTVEYGRKFPVIPR